ncbi:nitroreductase/quinone reductase family protein [Lacisediminihabitans profunda]|uniref:Nitroreductase family deazaflavin-dependent oxidoreductase n=1 Tax=Lacisediminihabitans profunda TaxID=2594790 RepID=A0A5C8UR20_9MICO|nr:nitroreductase/quinone reductase family protein [Lacisediminihabitans profunda]TXN30649.1 nitroreductase family deazaflavin-dependent oxidoreductase [Lacisediminihabitans profunda]
MASLVRGVRVAVAAFTRTALFRRFGPVVMPPLERAMTVLTRGTVPLSGLLVPSLVLRTTGAKSGLEHETTLMYCPEGRGRMLVVGSNFAREDHPAWTANLLAEPRATAIVRGRSIPVLATIVGDEERERVWRLIEAQWPNYREYERQSGRTLRIFRLEPVASGAPTPREA